MIPSIIAFLVMLNPFALFLYMEPIRKDLTLDKFIHVILKATVISFVICIVFFYFGNPILQDLFQINFESFRIFGGIIIFSFAYYFIVKGHRAMIVMKEDLDDLASEIALPFMVGAGTISLSILFSQKFSPAMGSLALLFVFAVNFLILVFLAKFRHSIEGKKIKVAFDKNLAILLRVNGFFIGAIGVDMIVMGINNLYMI